jgi:hypothetical protein
MACPGPDKILPNFLYRLREVDLAVTVVRERDGKQHVKTIRSPGGLTTRKLGALRSRFMRVGTKYISDFLGFLADTT